MSRSVIAAAISSLIAIISVTIMIVEATITPEAWALLLLTPFPVAIAISSKQDSIEDSSESMGDWTEDNEDHEDCNVGDPADAGFDVPVL